MRRWAVLLAFVFILSACSRGENLSDGEAVQPPESAPFTVSADILCGDRVLLPILEQAVSEYSGQNTGVKFTILTESDPAYDDGLERRMNSTQPPVLFTLSTYYEAEKYKERSASLSELSVIEDIPVYMLGLTDGDGDIFAFPARVDALGLVYDRAVFSSAGVDASSVNTFEGLKAAFAAIKSEISSGRLTAFPSLESVCELPFTETRVPFEYASNISLAPDFSFDVKRAFSSSRLQWRYADAYKSAIDLFMQFSKYATDSSGAASVTDMDVLQKGLAKRRIACTIQTCSVYNEIAEVDKRVADSLRILPLPIYGLNEDSIFVLFPSYWCINNSASAEQQQAAADFLNWLYTSKDGKRIFGREGAVPPNFDDSMIEMNPLAASALSYLNAGKTMSAVSAGYPDTWVGTVLSRKLRAYIEGDISWDKMLSDSADEWAHLRGALSMQTELPEMSPSEAPDFEPVPFELHETETIEDG